MGEDFKPGDVAVCISDEWISYTHGAPPHFTAPRKGSLYRVSDVGSEAVCDWLRLHGLDHRWSTTNFRKLPKADEEFTASIRACKPSRNRVPA